MSSSNQPNTRMIRAVYDSFGTGRHNGDATARRVMDRIVSWLVAGLELSPRLNAKLVDNINMRTKYRVGEGNRPFKLSRDQIQYARNTNPEWFAIGLDGQDLPVENERDTDDFHASIPQSGVDITQVSHTFHASITQLFHNFHALFPQDAHTLAQELVSMSSNTAVPGTTSCPGIIPKVMEWEEKKSNRSDDSMIRPEDDMRLAGSPPMTSAVAVDDEPGIDEQGAYRDVGGSHCQDGNAHRGNEPVVEQPTSEVAVSFFHTDAYAPPSANLELGSEKFALVFSDADRAEEQLYEVCSPEWLGQFNAKGGDAVRNESRAAQSSKTRYRLSPLYAARDTFGRKVPVARDALAVLFWSDDQQPEHVMVFRGDDVIHVPLSAFRGRHAKAPSHKGITQVAA